MHQLESTFFGVIRTNDDEMYAGQIEMILNTNPTVFRIYVAESTRPSGSRCRHFMRLIPLSNIKMLSRSDEEMVSKLNDSLRSGSRNRVKRVLEMMRGDIFFPALNPTVEGEITHG